MNESFDKAKAAIDRMTKDPIGLNLLKRENITNVINRIGSNIGYTHLSSQDEELYNSIENYLMSKIKPADDKIKNVSEQGKLFNESKKNLKETSHEIQEPRVMLRYEDDDVVTAMKDILSKKFKNITLEQIKGDEGGAFYSMIISLDLEENVKNDLELNRFYITQAMTKFKGEFFGLISEKLPVINIRTGSFQFSKNSTKLKFEVLLCLSHTNDREWVSGIDKTSKNKKELGEASSSKKSMIKPISLKKAIQRFNAGSIDTKMLETAIKACGRSELEYYVLRSVGINPDVDLQKAEEIDKPDESEKNDSSENESSEETPYKPNSLNI